jgi:hypothetical protein
MCLAAQRGNKMKNRCKDFGELSPANRLAGCVNIDINCAALPARHVRSSYRVKGRSCPSSPYVDFICRIGRKHFSGT